MHCRLQATTMCMGWQLCGLVGACLGWRASNSKPLWLLLCSEGQSIQQLLETNTIWRPLTLRCVLPEQQLPRLLPQALPK